MKKRDINAADMPRPFLGRKAHKKTHDRFNQLRKRLTEQLGVTVTQVQVIEWLLNFSDQHKNCAK